MFRIKSIDDLFSGDIFTTHGYSVDYELCMRIQSIYSEMDNCLYNAVSLVTGTPIHFEDEEEIELYDGSVIFDEKLFKSEIKTD